MAEKVKMYNQKIDTYGMHDSNFLFLKSLRLPHSDYFPFYPTYVS
jgi:hypothetical protein